MDGTTTNIVVGNSLRNLWLHDGRVNNGAGVILMQVQQKIQLQ